ncbi:MAG: hypothetical protein ACK4F4_10300 [Hylemonella sp.]|uniref:hypothetical protein n=1 Tax=Hylemonella sp. TaxID=2066020 RepID=UPI00391C2A27
MSKPEQHRTRPPLGRTVRIACWAGRMIRSLLVVCLAGTALAASGQELPEGHTKVVTKSRLGAWMLREDPAHPRMNCSVKFISSSKNPPGLTILGPTKNSPHAVILFSGADIPVSSSMQDVQVELVQQDLPPTRLRAKQFPRQAGSPDGVLAIGVGDIRQTLKSMRDRESNMQLRMERTSVFSLDYDGLALARDAMLGCVEGRQFAGQTLKAATAELRPLGTSVIKGQAYFKGALLAAKKYPPKGSETVGLIWMTDEFKVWYEQVKRDQKMPKHIPQTILKHFMRTKILDDKGSFMFTNMPPGEYLLITDFSYERTRNQVEVIGRTDVYTAGGHHIGSNDRITVNTYAFQQGVTFEKRVVVSADGETIEVTLDKSCLFGC